MNFREHPCFSEKAAHTSGRIHLPVAPKCNIQCNFCDRKYDCMNESRPGVTSTILTPLQAADYLSRVIERIPQIAVAGIAGPGDPLANPQETLETFRLVKERFPGLYLCMATNGLELETWADDIAALGVNHVTVTVNTTDPETGSRIYSWVRYNKRPRRGTEASSLLLERQRAGIIKLKKHGIILKINTVVIPGVNDTQAADIAREMSLLGADIHNCIPLYSVRGTVFGDINPLTAREISAVRESASAYLRQMSHCKRCRADAAGMLGESNPEEIARLLRDASRQQQDPGKPYVAVATMEGIFVNRHLGESRELWIFSDTGNGIELVEKRETPPPGGGDKRWNELADILHDCMAVLASGAGEAPVSVLESRGIRVITMEGMAEEGLSAVFSGGKVPAVLTRVAGKCGIGMTCGGTGTGCG